jgi:hypothetical protein
MRSANTIGSMEAESLTQLRAIGDRMRELKPAAEAAVFYELMSDALVWSDEIPDLDSGDVSVFHCLRFVFRFRTTLMMGKPDERFRKLWDEAKTLFPNWPGFDPRRQAVEYRPVYERFCELAKADIRELFDKPVG